MNSPYPTRASRIASGTLIGFGSTWLALISITSIFWHLRPFVAPGNPSPDLSTTVFDITAVVLLAMQIRGAARSWNGPIPVWGLAATAMMCLLTATTNAVLVYSIPCVIALCILLFTGYGNDPTSPTAETPSDG
ncbi:hypothetical protein RISK_002772 [Rhodopirellula islandica]|uniref:Transmembrane protein n=1 Tax=Rhodopirellula islandica TaxID=595434 RepID=A0A0J1BFA0_RHOIS|nr:hypothetical protein [Rhodopirellula islandica]KLU05196.1 hypothetical protein RISK_002772 [Rhodopirellula islandica]